jgi:hypothetical protein
LPTVTATNAFGTAGAYVNGGTNTWTPIGPAYGFTTKDIYNFSDAPTRRLTETFAYPGLATIVTVWLSST